jgi:transposase InsO family protein
VRYAWIEKQAGLWPARVMCEVLDVSLSGLKAWRSGGKRSQRLTDAQLLVLIRAIHAQFKGAYGSPRMHEELRERGHRVGKARVERLMRSHGIRARHKRRWRATTDSKHELPVAQNLLARDFCPGGPNQSWGADITYIATDEGWLYLAAVIDLFSRQVVGWSMQPHMQASLVTDALRMAWFRRHPAPGLIFHSDRGSQYCSHSFQDALASYGMLSSMSRKGNCWDNAPTESLWGSLKVGRLHGKKFATQREAMDEVIDWLTFYNHRRLHSTLGYISPMRFEANWHAGQAKKAA